MSVKYLVPKPGFVVRDPVTKTPLPAEGREVAMTTYWLRRLREGDVLEGAPVKSAKSKE